MRYSASARTVGVVRCRARCAAVRHAPLQPRVGEPLPAEPVLVRAGPRLPAGVDDPLPQQEFRQPVPAAHQVATDVLPGAWLVKPTGHPYRLSLMSQALPIESAVASSVARPSAVLVA